MGTKYSMIFLLLSAQKPLDWLKNLDLFFLYVRHISLMF